MTDSLKDKVAIITGASSGIGEATARRLAESGARVVLAARRVERLEALAADIEHHEGTALVAPTDVTDERSVQRLARTALDAFGRIDILINNAGIMPLSPISKLRVEEWDRMIDVNIKGVLYCIAATLPTMLEQGSGHIINVSSVAGRRPFPSGTVYSATKFAVRAISQGLRLELSPINGIRVTDIEPGVVATELTHHITDNETANRFQEMWAEKTPLESIDIAETILFVLSRPDHVNVNEILVRPTDQPT
ncbi:MAG: SDR family oxidoreductase [Gemmatimonadetes bacterium]|nr:SDR family oxidoreductase [Gemmatimonadota bacterium]